MSLKTNMLNLIKRPKIVGEFIRKRREALNLSQRAIGLMFDPPVTTQFISNVERGVTPLPPAHVPTLARALAVNENELTVLLEREYTMKLSDRLGKSGDFNSDTAPVLAIAQSDYDFMRNMYEAYQHADPETKQAFNELCHNMLKVNRIQFGTQKS